MTSYELLSHACTFLAGIFTAFGVCDWWETR